MHMPNSHRRYRDWTHERIRREAIAPHIAGPARMTTLQLLAPHSLTASSSARFCVG
jgi:hypothetical protein